MINLKSSYAIMLLLLLLANPLLQLRVALALPNVYPGDIDPEKIYEHYVSASLGGQSYSLIAGRYVEIRASRIDGRILGSRPETLHALAYLDGEGWIELPLRIYVDKVDAGDITYYTVPKRINGETLIDIKMPTRHPSFPPKPLNTSELRRFVKGAQGYVEVNITIGQDVFPIYLFTGSEKPNTWIAVLSLDVDQAFGPADTEQPLALLEAGRRNHKLIQGFMNLVASRRGGGEALLRILAGIAKKPVDIGRFQATYSYVDEAVPDGGEGEYYNLVEKSELVGLFPVTLYPDEQYSFTVEPYDLADPDTPVTYCDHVDLVFYVHQSSMEDPVPPRTFNVYVNGELYESATILKAGMVRVTLYFYSKPKNVTIEMPDIQEPWDITAEMISYLQYPNVLDSILTKRLKFYPLVQLVDQDNTPEEYMVLRVMKGETEGNITIQIPNPFHQKGVVLEYTGSYPELTLRLEAYGGLGNGYTGRIKVYFLGDLVIDEPYSSGMQVEKNIDMGFYRLFRYLEYAYPQPIVVKLELNKPVESIQEDISIKLSLEPEFLEYYVRPLINITTGNGNLVWTSAIRDNDYRVVYSPGYKLVAKTDATFIHSNYPDYMLQGFYHSSSIFMDPPKIFQYHGMIYPGMISRIDAIIHTRDFYSMKLGDIPTQPMYVRRITVSIIAEADGEPWLRKAGLTIAMKYEEGWGEDLPPNIVAALFGSFLGEYIALSGLSSTAVSAIVGIATEEIYHLIREAATADVYMDNSEGDYTFTWDADVLNLVDNVALEFRLEDIPIETSIVSGRERLPVKVRVEIVYDTSWLGGGLRGYSYEMEYGVPVCKAGG